MNRIKYILAMALLLLMGAATPSFAQTIKGKIYGGGELATVDGNTQVRINSGAIGDGTDFDGGVFGGGLGEPTVVTGNVDVIIGKTGSEKDAAGPTINGDVYGGSALGNTNCSADLVATADKATNVTLNAGTINGSMYGGALGQKNGVAGATKDVAANVYGSVQVAANGGIVLRREGDDGGTYSGGIYGCNNFNGSPQAAVNVDIHHHNTTKPVEDMYTLFSVYGGGNQANYIAGTPVVTVHGCDNSILYVYGGGNAAHLTHETDGVGDGNTNVVIWGCERIGNVFGGGNGQVQAANVSGSTNVEIYGGTIENVFGGSNTNGMIGGTTNVHVLAQGEGGDDACAMALTNVYGGGNRAAGKSGTVNIACTGEGTIENVYGGANDADLTGDITLNIHGGKITNVFGGNNNSGRINGAITVNVDWNDDCTGNSLGNVFGCGNLAQYYAYGYTVDGDTWTPNAANETVLGPTVNIKNGTVTNNVYGGGKGDAADHTKGQVTGNPVVTIGVADNGKQAIVNGDVYGGGDAGNVVGIPVVNVINKCNTQIANVYGGGNAADVSGTDVNIDGGTISGMVFGGGHGSKDNPDTDEDETKVANVGTDGVSLTVTGGTIYKVFGGSNSNGNILGQIALNINKGNNSCPMHITEVYGGGNLAAGNGGTITIGCTGGETEGIGDVYGGANAADINSDITLNITGGNINNVFGGNNQSGLIRGAIKVVVDWEGNCDNNHLDNVYGVGNVAHYSVYGYTDDGRSKTKGNDNPKLFADPVVEIRNCTISYNVFGGGLGTAAVVTGNPQVKIGIFDGEAQGHNTEQHSVLINESVYGGGSQAAVEGSTDVNITSGGTTPSKKVEIKKDVFGGGSQAAVTEHTNVYIKGSTVEGYVYGGGSQGTVGSARAEDDPKDYTKVIVEQSEVGQDVFGGGLGAEVTGNTAVWIKGIDCFIHGSVLGGGFGGDVTGDTHVQIGGETDKYKKCHLTGGTADCND